MKKKLSKILGVGLALVMVLSLGVALMPVNQAQAAAEGNMQWNSQQNDLPDATGSVLLTGSNVNDIAVFSDGQTIYAINNAVTMTGAAAAPWALYKSTNAGQSFTGIDLSGVTSALGNTLGCVAVSPDDPNAAAISMYINGTQDVVFITSNGGISWAALPAFDAPAGANSDVMDLAVGPARSGTIFGREYMVALADRITNVTTTADVQIIGGTAAWASIGAVGVTTITAAIGRYDYMACAFSPSYVGDRTVVVIGSDNSTAATGVHLQLVDTRTRTEVRNVVLDANVDDWDIGAGTTTGEEIFAADIALPIDWDPSSAGGQRTYCSTASGGTVVAGDNDSVYRVDAATVWDLSVGVTNIQWESIAYSGTIAEGTLFAGAYAVTAGAITTNVKYAADPQLMQPLWKSANTPPTGTGGLAVVRVAPDFAETQRAFVGTGGPVNTATNETAFSVSYNGGTSYQQESLIFSNAAANVVTVDDIALTPDGGTIYMATDDAAQLSLWKSATPVSATSWSRIYCQTDAGPGMLALNPKWDDTPALIFADNDPAGGGRVYVSQDGGDTYAARWTASTTNTIQAIAMESADVAYIAQNTNVYKSTNACWIWGGPYAIGLGVINQLDASAADLVLVGAANAVAYSVDGGTSYTTISSGLAGGTYVVCPDSSYADEGNGYVYAASTLAVDSVFRFQIGVSSGWDNLVAAPGVAAVGVAMNNGALYAMTATQAARTLGPHGAPGTVTWRYMTAGAPVGMAAFDAQNNHLYAADTGAGNFDMEAYSDYLATTAPVITSPDEGALISVDPVTGRANIVELIMNAMGEGTGLANDFSAMIWPKTQGFGAAIYDAANAPWVATGPTIAIVNTVDAVVANDISYNLIAGTEYEMFIRAADTVSGDVVCSQWSDILSFKVEAGLPVVATQAGPILTAPQAGGVGVSLTPGFAWAPITNAVKYEFELSTSAATTARGYFIDALVGKTGDNALVSAGWQCDIALEYGTSYFWHIKAITADGGESVWGTAQFTTLAEAEVPAPPAPPVELPAPITPAWIWAIVIIGAVLVIVVIVLIFVTRKP